jgi:hypothetical protein
LRLHRASVRIVLFSFLCSCVLLTACGGGSSHNSTQTVNTSFDASGVWYFTLSENQAAPHSNGPTQIAMSLTQTAPGAGFLTTAGSGYGYSAACYVSQGVFWWFGDGWNPNTFQLSRGSVTNGSISLELNEALNGNISDNSAHGLVTLTGTLQPDGSLSGTGIDGCSSPANAQFQWTAKRGTALPQ